MSLKGLSCISHIFSPKHEQLRVVVKVLGVESNSSIRVSHYCSGQNMSRNPVDINLNFSRKIGCTYYNKMCSSYKDFFFCKTWAQKSCQ